MAIIYKSISLPKPGKRLSIREYYEKRNTILVVRATGGVGDILMSRMIFEDFKRLMPEAKIIYAVPRVYHELLQDHPYIDEVIDSKGVDYEQYTISYNISSICGKYEQSVAPRSNKHRSDIWANHCGVELQSHDMHLTVDKNSKKFGKELLDKYREPGKPIVLLCPISAMKSKNLDEDQMNGVANGLKDEGCTVLGMHHRKIEELSVPTLENLTLRQWLGIIDQTDYLITVDSGPFHAAGGLNKPTVAIFSWADGKTYGKWYTNYILVQRHRDNGNWECGPCYIWPMCPKSNCSRKPCITEITAEEVIRAAKRMFEKWKWRENAISK